MEKQRLKATGGKTRKEKPEDANRAIRLSNNSITVVQPILSMLVLQIPTKINFENIAWIDLSFNSITSISDDMIATLPNLSTLNMHANQVTKLSDLKKLKSFSKLRSLSLCGNPVAENKHYRNMILYYCAASIVQLDFGAITNSERQKVVIWEQVYRNKLHPDGE